MFYCPSFWGTKTDFKSEESWRAFLSLGVNRPLQHGNKLEVKEELTGRKPPFHSGLGAAVAEILLQALLFCIRSRHYWLSSPFCLAKRTSVLLRYWPFLICSPSSWETNSTPNWSGLNYWWEQADDTILALTRSASEEIPVKKLFVYPQRYVEEMGIALLQLWMGLDGMATPL